MDSMIPMPALPDTATNLDSSPARIEVETVPQPPTASPPLTDAGLPPRPSKPPLTDAGLPPRPSKPPSGRGGPRHGAGRPPRKTEINPGGEPPPPFAGGPPIGEGAAPSTPVAAVLAAATPDSMAMLAVVALDGAVQAVATWRYGEAEAKTLRGTDAAKAELHAALLFYIKASGAHMTPLQAVLAAAAGCYGPPIIQRELEGKARRGLGARAAL